MNRRPSVPTAVAAGAALSLLGATAFGAAGPAAAAPPAPVKASPSSAANASAAAALGTPEKVIVLLRNQHAAVPATVALASRRAALLAGDQKPLVSSLAAAGATGVRTYRTINAVAATVSGAEAGRLAADPAVLEVIPDSVIRLNNPTAAAKGAAAAGATPKPGVCAPAGKVQLNPEALQTTHTASDVRGALTARSLGATGAGVKVAYIAEGIDINNPDFIRANGSHVFVDYQDFSGEGTAAPTGAGEAFLDASSIAAQGRRVYDVSHYSALPLNRPCLIRVEGVAPGASLVGLKVFAAKHFTLTSQFLQAIDYAVAVDHVDVLNESFGSNPFPDRSNDVTRLFNEQAVQAGTTVVASSGDAGVTNTIGSPASDPKVLAVGASTTFRIYQQIGLGLTRLSGATGWLSNNISSLSSGGVTEAGRTVDLAAPGDLNWALCTPDLNRYLDCRTPTGAPASVTDSGGTSESAPLTAGAAALVIQAFRATHRGASPTPAEIKTILTGTADDIVAPAEQQGAGLLDTYKAVLAARSFPTTGARPKRVGANLLTSTNQIDVVAAPGTGVTRRVTVTNIGAGPQTVTITDRALGAYRKLLTARTVLSDTASRKATEIQGLRYNYQVVHFRVPAGVGRLDAAISFVAASPSLDARVRLTLIDPARRVAGYSLPQGIGNFGDTQVANPRAGLWTAYISSRTTDNGGTTGPVVFGARTASFVSVGRVTPSVLRIASGKSAAFTYTATTPAVPGDATTALVVRASANAVYKTTTVPVVLRSLLPVRTSPRAFTATLTGGNGRSAFTGVTGYYQLSVPAGTPELNARVTLPVATNPFSAYLVSPTGQALAYAGSQLLGIDSKLRPVGVNERAAQLHVLRPAAGRWDLVINFTPTVAGDVLSQTYTVEADGAAVPVSSTDLPRKATTTLRAGRPTTVHITVHNTGSAPEAFFLDPRKNLNAFYPLAVVPASVTLPLTAQQTTLEPTFLVPTDSTTLAARVTSTGPVTFDMGANFGDPDITAVRSGNVAVARISSNPLTQGGWFIGPTEVGPYGSGPAPIRTATAAAAVATRAFDTTVTSPGGDLWLESVDPAAAVTPVVVSPGATAVLTAVITPTGKVGSTATGTLYVDDANVLNSGVPSPNGNQVAALPYTYKVRR